MVPSETEPYQQTCTYFRIWFGSYIHVDPFVFSRFGLLSEEPVPHANTILEALAKHFETKLSFGKPRTSSCFN